MRTSEPSLDAHGDTVVIGTLEGSDEEVPVTVTSDRDSASFLLGEDLEVVSWNGEGIEDRTFANEHFSVTVRFPDADSEGSAKIARVKPRH